jgi:hypothetical protein
MTGRSPVGRPVGAATIVAAMVTVWASAARASGHGPDALGEVVVLALLIFAGLPWAISLLLLLRKSSPATCIVGTLTSGSALMVVLVAALPPWPLYAGLALAPAAAHLIKRGRARRAKEAGSAEEALGRARPSR